MLTFDGELVVGIDSDAQQINRLITLGDRGVAFFSNTEIRVVDLVSR